MNRWLPQPLFSLCLWLIWLLLNNSGAPGQALLGALLAVAVPLFTVRFWPNRPRLQRPWRLASYLAVLLWDITLANLVVARLILGPIRQASPGIYPTSARPGQRFRRLSS